MKLCKMLLPFLFAFTAIITSSEITECGTSRHGHYIGIKATFDIYQDGTKVDSSFQCGYNAERVLYGIQQQLKWKQTEVNAKLAEERAQLQLQQDVKRLVGVTVKEK